MTCKTCKDCPARYPACHDYCPQFAAWRKEHAKETDYNRKMTVSGRVYRYDYEDKHRKRCSRWHIGSARKTMMETLLFGRVLVAKILPSCMMARRRTMGLSFAPTVAQRWRNNQNEIDGRQWIENNPLR